MKVAKPFLYSVLLCAALLVVGLAASAPLALAAEGDQAPESASVPAANEAQQDDGSDASSEGGQDGDSDGDDGAGAGGMDDGDAGESSGFDGGSEDGSQDNPGDYHPGDYVPGWNDITVSSIEVNPDTFYASGGEQSVSVTITVSKLVPGLYYGVWCTPLDGYEQLEQVGWQGFSESYFKADSTEKVISGTVTFNPDIYTKDQIDYYNNMYNMDSMPIVLRVDYWAYSSENGIASEFAISKTIYPIVDSNSSAFNESESAEDGGSQGSGSDSSPTVTPSTNEGSSSTGSADSNATVAPSKTSGSAIASSSGASSSAASSSPASGSAAGSSAASSAAASSSKASSAAASSSASSSAASSSKVSSSSSASSSSLAAGTTGAAAGPSAIWALVGIALALGAAGAYAYYYKRKK